MNAGLGKRKLKFPNKNAAFQDLQKFLEEKFPKLNTAGGFEVLRASGGGGGQRPLSLLLPGREGYSVPFLKERLGQGIAYIRPPQVDLDENPVELEVCNIFKHFQPTDALISGFNIGCSFYFSIFSALELLQCTLTMNALVFFRHFFYIPFELTNHRLDRFVCEHIISTLF